MGFANYLFLLVEKVFLARLSTGAMEAAVNVAYVCQVFQGASMALAMMTQVFVGRWIGAKEYPAIGPGVWQFIWFSFLSMIVTVPGSLLYGNWYFQGTDIEKTALPYFYLLVGAGFLYPLGVVFSSFYLGQGKTRLVLLGNLGAQLVKIGMGYVLIFGWGPWIPPLGLIGGAISTVIAQGGLCLLLGGTFMAPRYATLFNSRKWRFQPKLFWECIHPGLLRAMSRISCFLSWSLIAHMMASRGGDYLLVLSIGGSLFLFLPFLSEAICQAQTTIVSQLLGSKKFFLLNQAFRSGFLLACGIVALMGLPFIAFPTQTLHFLFPGIILDMGIRKLFFGIWASFAFFTISFIPISYVLAFKDMKFSLFMGLMNWVNGYLLMFWAIEKFQIRPNEFWLALSVMHATGAIAFFWRMKVLCKRAQVTASVLT
jgi:MATE family multidrug resistance protein